jgi:CHASE3 domain sensor protein
MADKNIQLEIELFNQNKLSDYQKITYLTEGKKLTDKIRASVAVIHNIEINQLVIRKKANDRNVNIFNILFLLIFTTILILLFIVFIIFRNQKIKNDYAKELEAQVADRTKELAIQNIEKEKRANELTIANRELNFQNAEKENRANELIIS